MEEDELLDVSVLLETAENRASLRKTARLGVFVGNVQKIILARDVAG